MHFFFKKSYFIFQQWLVQRHQKAGSKQKLKLKSLEITFNIRAYNIHSFLDCTYMLITETVVGCLICLFLAWLFSSLLPTALETNVTLKWFCAISLLVRCLCGELEVTPIHLSFLTLCPPDLITGSFLGKITFPGSPPIELHSPFTSE